MPKRMIEKLSFPARTAVAVAAATASALALCAVFAVIASLSDNPTANLPLYGEISFCASMLFCGLLGAKLAADKRFVCGVAAGGVMLLLTAVGALILADNLIKALILSALGLFISAAGSALGSREVKRKRRR